MNLCPLCKSIHDNTHSIINYDNKDYKCHKHREDLVEYCNDCNKDICISCSFEHKQHKKILYRDILINIDVDNLKNKMKEFENLKNNLKKFLDEIIKELKTLIENMEIIYNINNNILSNYDINKNRNYILLLNLNYMSEYIEYEIDKIKN